MPLSNPDLWQKIADWPLPFRAERDEEAKPPRDCICFEDNLRKQGDWTDASARALVEEYRRYLYLRSRHGDAFFLPPCLEQVAKLHQDIKPEDMAKLEAALGTEIRRDAGLKLDAAIAAYQRLLKHYRAEFFEAPPALIWPSPRRLAIQPQTRWVEMAAFGLGIAAFLGGLVLEVTQGSVPGGAENMPRGNWVALGFVAVAFVAVGIAANAFKPHVPPRIRRGE